MLLIVDRDFVDRLRSYLAKVTGTHVPLAPLPAAAESLPVFIRQTYAVYRTEILQQPYFLLLCSRDTPPTPKEVEKHARIVQSALGSNVIFAFSALPPVARSRLIARRIPFIEPHRQAYLPQVLLDLRERSGWRSLSGKPRQSLSVPAQLILLFHLQVKSDTGSWPIHEWARALQYSRMTMSRAWRELVAAHLCRARRSGRELSLEFLPSPRQLWDKALPHLSSPLIESMPARILDRGAWSLYQSGIPALASFSMIATPGHEVFAVSAEDYRSAVRSLRITPVPYLEEGSVIVERWKYAPGLLSPGRQQVDRLSLYLSLRDDPDERVQAALTEMLEGMPW